MADVDFSDWADELDPETIDKGGLPKPGKCQLLVAKVEDKGDYVSFTSQILAHEDKSQVGKNTFNTVNKGGKGSKRAFLFALATGIITRQDIAEAKEAGTSIDIPFESAYGKLYYGTLAASTYNGKAKCRVEWDFKSLDSPEAKEYPSDPEFTPGEEETAGASAGGDDDVPF